MKFRIGTDWSWNGITVDRFLGLVRELVQAVDSKMELMLDANCRLNEEHAFQILDKKAYDIVQQDVGICGISEGMKIARMAYDYGVLTCPHNWHNELMTMANAHFVAALPEPRILELCMIQGPLQWEIISEKPKIENGWLFIPEKSGLGVEFADNLEERFPYIDGPYGIQVKPED